MPPVVLAHAEGEEELADLVAAPLREAGYDVRYEGTLLVGESVVQEVSAALEAGSPVVLCGTVRAMGTGWAFKVVNAAHRHVSAKIFPLQMEKQAYLEPLSLGVRAAPYWQDPAGAISELIAALGRYYPADSSAAHAVSEDLEARYRDLALRSYDIVDLANLPVSDRSLATRQLLLRSLYVPLRVAIEPDDEAADEPSFRAHLTIMLQPSDRHEPAEEVPAAHEVTVYLDMPGTGLEPTGEAPATQLWSVGRLLAERRRLTVLGDLGAGKSTLLRWLATGCLLRLNADPDLPELPDIAELPDEDWLPILMRCRDYGPRSARALSDLLSEHLGQLGVTGAELGQLTELLLDRLAQGRALLLLDGLDEIVDPAARARFCKQIEQMHVAYPLAPIVATSRVAGYRETGLQIGRGFTHCTVLELSSADKDEFARRWCTLTEPASRRDAAAQELIKDIHSTDRIERLTDSPMLLTTMALVKKKVGKLPGKRADLYREAVDVLLNWRSDVDELLDPHEAWPQLEYLAYAMCQRGVQRLREDEIVELLSTMRAEFPSVHAAHRRGPLDFLRLLERRTGILVEVGRVRHNGRPMAVFEFRHLTFQDYLAGLALVEGRYPGRDRQLSLAESIGLLAAQVSDSGGAPTVSENWREAIRLCVTSCNDDDVDAVLLAIMRLGDEDAAATAMPRAILALSCLADEPNASEPAVLALMDGFARLVRRDEPPSNWVWDATAEITTSLWGELLARRLVLAWLATDRAETGLGNLASRRGYIRAPHDPQELHDWLADRSEELSSADVVSRVSAALWIKGAVVGRRGAGLDRMPSGLKSRLLAMLERHGREAEAAAWAIMWLTLKNAPGKPVWRLSARQVSKLAKLIIDARTTALTTFWLLSALDDAVPADTGLAAAVASRITMLPTGPQISMINLYARLFPSVRDPLVQLSRHADRITRYAAARALGQAGDVRSLPTLAEAAIDPDAAGWWI